jgi:cell shape-determining protein MreC
MVFVYGREVDDFRTVDYEAIAMVNVSATQEIYRELTELKAENTELKKRADLLDELARQNATMEQRLAGLEKLISRPSLAVNGGAE